MLNLLIGAAALAAPCSSDVADRVATRAEARQVIAAAAERVTSAPPDDPMSLIRGGDISLDISETKSEATFEYAWDNPTRRVTADCQGVRITNTTLSIGVTLPIGGADNLLDSDTFDAFASGPSLSFNFTWFGFTSRINERLDSPAYARLMQRAVARCLENPGEGMTPSDCELYRTRPEPSFVERYLGVPAPTSGAIGIDLSAEFGFDLFDYRTPLTLAEHRRTEPNFTGTASLFYFPPGGVSLAALTVTYENAFEALDEEILCQAVIAVPNDDCVKAAPGRPRNVERLLIGAEYRLNIGEVRGLGSFGIAPQAGYDVIGDHYRLELPIYLTPEGESSFLPGISFSYESEDDDFVVGIFLRKRFSLGP
jgi:hypothetical protein